MSEPKPARNMVGRKEIHEAIDDILDKGKLYFGEDNGLMAEFFEDIYGITEVEETAGLLATQTDDLIGANPDVAERTVITSYMCALAAGIVCGRKSVLENL